MKKLHILLFLLTIATYSIAQSYHEFNTQVDVRQDEARQFLPTTFQGDTKVQIFFTNEELSSGLNPGDEIIGLEWYVHTDNTPTTNIFDLYVTDDYTDPTLPSGTNFATVPMTLVGSSLSDAGQYTGWHSVNFDAPFVWDGTDNFIIQTCKTIGSGQNISDNLGMIWGGVGYMQSGYWNVSCPDLVSTVADAAYRPQIRLIVNHIAPPCSIPTNVQHVLQSPARCVINWDEVPEATKYDVLYRVKGTTEWSRIGALNNYRTLRQLAPNTTYQYRVRSYCGSWDFANATGIREFNTANIPMSRLGITDTKTEITSISPNPARDIVNVEFYNEVPSDVTLSIRDLTGRLVYENNIGNVEGMQTEAIDISNLGGGYYMVMLQSAEKREVKKFVIAK